jgi:archaellum component FlaD/FlaE
MTQLSNAMPALRRDELRNALLATVDSLKRRRADQIPEDYIDDYVTLNWLEWNGGGLRLTETGSNVCRQLSARLG